MMGTAIVKRSHGHLRPSLVPIAKGFTLFAPSLRSLAAGSTLVMATLPVLDWNGELMKALPELGPGQKDAVFAGVLACDPFACWADIADGFIAAGIGGVANFPATAMTTGPGMVDLDAAGFGFRQELDRLAWFADEGFQVLVMTASAEQGVEAVDRLGDSMFAACVIRPDDIDRPVDTAIAIVPADELPRPGHVAMTSFRLSPK